MRIKFTFSFLTLFFLSYYSPLVAQDEGDYQAVTSGNWGQETTWQRYTSGNWIPASMAPTSADGVIHINTGITVTVAAPVTVDQVLVDGTLTVNAALSILNGVGQDLSISTSGILNLASASSFSGVINNAGIINWSSGNQNFAGAVLDNHGVINITGNNEILNGSGANGLNNHLTGSINRNTGTGEAVVRIPLDNKGAINTNSGTLRTGGSTSPIVNTGSFNFSNDATFSTTLSTTSLDAGTTFTGTGKFRAGANSLTSVNTEVTIPAGVAFEVNSEVNGSGNLIIDGELYWANGFIRVPVTVTNDGVAEFEGTVPGERTLNSEFILNGTLNWIGGDFRFSTGVFRNYGVFNINRTGTYELRRTTSPTINEFTNAGLINKIDNLSLVIGSQPLSVNNTNVGVIRGNGTISFAGGIINEGTIAPGNSAGELTTNPTVVSSTSNIEIEILSGGGPGIGHDHLILTGATDLSGAGLTIIDDAAAPIGTYIIMTTAAGTFSGTFGVLNKPSNFNDPEITGNTITIEKTSILPVIWGAFNLLSSEKDVTLSWSTLLETNTSHFAVEHSVDGKIFSVIGNVKAQGNSSVTSHYSFRHENPSSGVKNYYRLRQVDLDGKSAYSVIKLVSFIVNDKTAKIYPNPVGDIMQVAIVSKMADLTITDYSGKILIRSKLQRGNREIPLRDLRPGIYVVTIIDELQQVTNMRIIKQ